MVCAQSEILKVFQSLEAWTNGSKSGNLIVNVYMCPLLLC